MSTPIPSRISIYHIVHMDRIPSIVANGGLYSDALIRNSNIPGSTIGMQKIKDRRLHNALRSHPGLTVGMCVPFYFCPRSVMLYVISRQNHEELDYKGGQESIVHLVADLHRAVQWASVNNLRWAFTSTNAGSLFFDDYSSLNDLDKVDWEAVERTQWIDCRERKQAEYLVENYFPWELFYEIGVYSDTQANCVGNMLSASPHRPQIMVHQDWYY